MRDALGASVASQIRYSDWEFGLFSGADALLADLDQVETERARAEEAALRAYLWFADQPGGALPAEELLAEWAQNEHCHEPVARMLGLCQRARLLAFDAAGSARLSTIAASVLNTEAPTTARLDFVQLMAVAIDQNEVDAKELHARLTHVFDRARKASMAALVIDTQCALSILDMMGSDLVQATAVARRASRMARTEGLPQQQYLANLLLARVRRLNGVPHLATHILSALARIAPSAYQPWIRWERLLAGTLLGDAPTLSSPAEQAAKALDEQLASALGGDREAQVVSRANLLRHVAAFPLVHAEAKDLCVALNPSAPIHEASDAMRSWIAGIRALPPHGLYGSETASEEIEATERDVGYIVVVPGSAARRVLGIATRHPGITSLQESGRTDRRRARVETGLAVLALHSPETLLDTAFFRLVYGFEFNPAVHPAVLDALVSRMRKTIVGTGTLSRDNGLLRIDFAQAVTLSDPRCAQPLEDRILRVLVRSQHGTAKDAAAKLGLPLRTIQDALKELTDGGACLKQRDGRSIAYVVEDTTFAPPTQAGQPER